MTDRILPGNQVHEFINHYVNVRVNQQALISGVLIETNEDIWYEVGEALFQVEEIASIVVIDDDIFIQVQVDKCEES